MAPVVAIAQVAMHWTLADNLAEIERAMRLARAEGAGICAFAELAITGFHRDIVTQGVPEEVALAVERVCALAAELGLAVALGAPSFNADGARFNSHLLIDERGVLQARVHKIGLTAPEATFFQPGADRPVATLGGLRCTAVICREVEDHGLVLEQLQADPPDLVFWPGQMRPDPSRPPATPPEHVQQAMRLARDSGAWFVQSNWPNALNRPAESAGCGASACIAPDGTLMFQLPLQAAGVAVFTPGEPAFCWHPC
jgi:predicted amidohydrolase